MPKNKLKKFEGIKAEILLILKEKKQQTTECIRKVLERDYEIKATWKTIKSYLDELLSEKKIKKIEYGIDNKTCLWST